jgi:casein kinase I homolog HRR25
MSNTKAHPFGNQWIGGKYRAIRKLGAGSFGELYLGSIVLISAQDLNLKEVALKVESIRSQHPQLEYEARVYKALAGAGILY